MRRVVELAGLGAEGRQQMIDGDIRCSVDLERAFAAGASTGTGVDAVIHFAGLKAVGKRRLSQCATGM
jgi:UDP-glucose 4-epimerase